MNPLLKRIHELKQSFPEAFVIDAKELPAIEAYLRSKKIISEKQKVEGLAKAGEGNMNCTLRITLNDGETLILKQSRPWVEKYPQIDAPWDRSNVESAFYEFSNKAANIQALFPKILMSDRKERILAFQDLGKTSDYSDIYTKKEKISLRELQILCDFLSQLHSLDTHAANEILLNREMRKLNHAHIFIIPLQEGNGIDLDTITPGLGELATEYIHNSKFVEAVHQLGKKYLADGHTLVHGDFYPGSWLRTTEGIKIIDPEFCFLGSAEFDVGILIAHLKLAQCEESVIEEIFSYYKAPNTFQKTLAFQYAGVEIMRRILGVAQLSLNMNLETKKSLLQCSRSWLL